MTHSLAELERPETLTDAVANSIAEAIIRGTFAPGQALPEMPVASQLGTSRGTVREALRLLADQGLVDILPHRGAFVAQATPRKAREIFTLRAELETFAVQLVLDGPGYSAQTLASLESTLAALSQATDMFEVAELDMQFHDLLSWECQHQELLSVLVGLRLQMRRFMVYTKLVGSDLESEAITHQRLLDAVRSGSLAVATDEVRRHILVAGAQLVKKLEGPLAMGPGADRGLPMEEAPPTSSRGDRRRRRIVPRGSNTFRSRGKTGHDARAGGDHNAEETDET